MRRIVLAATLVLAACSSTDISAQIAAIQKTAMQICGFLPYATTIANILGKNAGGLKTAGEVAKAICDQVKPDGARAQSLSAPRVADVPIEGEFVVPAKE